MTIRQASNPEELAAIYRFRYAIYIEEMGKPMPGADHASRTLRDELDYRSTQLYAQDNGEIIGVVRVTWGADGLPENYLNWYGLEQFACFPKEEMSFNGRLMVSEKFRNSGVALALARQTYRLGRERGVAFNFLHTTPPLIPLFERFGHRRYAPQFIDPDLGPRTPMVLVLEDINHLENCKSPFASLARKTANRPEPVEWFKQQFGTLCPA